MVMIEHGLMWLAFAGMRHENGVGAAANYTLYPTGAIYQDFWGQVIRETVEQHIL
jgi:hypothetical protein